MAKETREQRERREKDEAKAIHQVRSKAVRDGDTKLVANLDKLIDGITAQRITRDDRELQERGE